MCDLEKKLGFTQLVIHGEVVFGYFLNSEDFWISTGFDDGKLPTVFLDKM